MTLTIPNIIPLASEVWRPVTQGQIDAVVALFERRVALPTDVDDVGRSLLHVSANTTIEYHSLTYRELAVITRQLAMADFLIANGADPDAQDSNGR